MFTLWIIDSADSPREFSTLAAAIKSGFRSGRDYAVTWDGITLVESLRFEGVTLANMTDFDGYTVADWYNRAAYTR